MKFERGLWGRNLHFSYERHHFVRGHCWVDAWKRNASIQSKRLFRSRLAGGQDAILADGPSFLHRFLERIDGLQFESLDLIYIRLQ